MGSRKIASLMKSKSGASLAFFLAVMFLLMIISSSVLVVASNARSTGLERRKSKQIEVLAQSVTKSLNKAIVKEEGIGKDIVLAMYRSEKHDPSKDLSGFNIEPKIHGVEGFPSYITLEDIVITFGKQNVEIVPEVEAIRDENGIEILPEIPEKSYISFQMTALLSCNDKSGQNLQCSIAYDYSDGYLENGHFVNGSDGKIDYGKWGVKNYAESVK